MGSQSPPSIPPFSDLLEDSKEEQELVILQTASTADWHASACDFSFGNTPGELPFLLGNEGHFAPFFSGAPFGSSLADFAGGIKVSAGAVLHSLSRGALLCPYQWLLGPSAPFFLPGCFCQTVPAKILSALPKLAPDSPGVGAGAVYEPEYPGPYLPMRKMLLNLEQEPHVVVFPPVIGCRVIEVWIILLCQGYLLHKLFIYQFKIFKGRLQFLP